MSEGQVERDAAQHLRGRAKYLVLVVDRAVCRVAAAGVRAANFSYAQIGHMFALIVCRWCGFKAEERVFIHWEVNASGHEWRRVQCPACYRAPVTARDVRS